MSKATDGRRATFIERVLDRSEARSSPRAPASALSWGDLDLDSATIRVRRALEPLRHGGRSEFPRNSSHSCAR